MAEGRADDRSSGLVPAILLVDMDSFFASVEVKDDPSLEGRPVLVGGAGDRGVVASCTYEARRFGIHSAMAMVEARRRCPQAVVLPGRMHRYAELSRQIHQIFRDVTPLVEPLGLDEAFLEVTGSRALLGSPASIAVGIRTRIASELGLDCAVGVASTKLVAKLASREAKPRITPTGVEPGPGVVVILDDEVSAFLDPKPVSALFGVGPSTAAALGRLGIERVEQLASIDPGLLAGRLGRAHAAALVGLAQGIDPRPVVADQAAKSIGHEETFADDIFEASVLEDRLRRQAVAVAGALRRAGRRGRTITVKVKMADFSLRTRSHSLLVGLDDPEAMSTLGRSLLASLDLSAGVRLLGLSVSNLEEDDRPVQLRLGVEDEEGRGVAAASAAAERLQVDRAELEDALSEIRQRFGRHAVGTAAMLKGGGLVVPEQRDQPFGPGARPSA